VIGRELGVPSGLGNVAPDAKAEGQVVTGLEMGAVLGLRGWKGAIGLLLKLQEVVGAPAASDERPKGRKGHAVAEMGERAVAFIRVLGDGGARGGRGPG
jgi:hypothetical protein